ncbi:MAG: hypothetical protein GX444_14070 [Myxococcales bacterium]|nr:hypothetical protein [Myxococcales bacterium]
MKRAMLAIVLLSALLASAGSALAEYGSWEFLYGLEPPGYSNAAFLGLSLADESNLYTVGMAQPSESVIDYGWVSNTAGSSWSSVLSVSFGANPCDIMKMMSFFMAVEAIDAQTALYGGMAINDDCLQMFELPFCMFACIFTFSNAIYYTEDGGMSLQEAKLPFGFGKSVTAMDKVDDDIVYAVGGPDLILVSTDHGQSWESVAAMPAPELTYSDVDFLTPELGYVIVGESEPEPETKGRPVDEQARLMYQHHVNSYRFLHDPIFQMETRRRNSEQGAPKGINGKVFRTTDGGATWELLMKQTDEAYSTIQMLNEDEGWLLGSPVEGLYPDFSIYRTTDGGDTWVDYTDHIPLDQLSYLSWWGLTVLSFNPSGTTGFFGGGGQRGPAYTSLIFYSIDRGETWQIDKSIQDWGHPLISFDWQGDKLAYQAGWDMSAYRYTQDNVPPVARAGDDQTVTVGDAVALDGSESYDPDGDPITFAWAQASGPAVDLTGADGATPSFVATAVGEVTIRLTVSDGQESGVDDVAITVEEAVDDDAADDDAADDDAADDDAADDDSHGVAGDDDNDDDNGSCGC